MVWNECHVVAANSLRTRHLNRYGPGSRRLGACCQVRTPRQGNGAGSSRCDAEEGVEGELGNLVKRGPVYIARHHDG